MNNTCILRLIIAPFIAILTLATFAYAWQNNSGMATATATIILVIITGYYAWNTHKQVVTMDEQANLVRDQLTEMHSQTNTMKNQFALMVKSVRRDRITKEMELLLLPLKIIYKEIDSRGVDNWYGVYTGYYKRTSTDRYTAEKFVSTIDSVDLNKYLAPGNLYPLIDEFINRLKDLKRNDDAEHRTKVMIATDNLFYVGVLNGGLVEERYHDLTAELQELDT
jgi:hypothetical protein